MIQNIHNSGVLYHILQKFLVLLCKNGFSMDLGDVATVCAILWPNVCNPVMASLWNPTTDGLLVRCAWRETCSVLVPVLDIHSHSGYPSRHQIIVDKNSFAMNEWKLSYFASVVWTPSRFGCIFQSGNVTLDRLSLRSSLMIVVPQFEALTLLVYSARNSIEGTPSRVCCV